MGGAQWDEFLSPISLPPIFPHALPSFFPFSPFFFFFLIFFTQLSIRYFYAWQQFFQVLVVNNIGTICVLLEPAWNERGRRQMKEQNSRSEKCDEESKTGPCARGWLRLWRLDRTELDWKFWKVTQRKCPRNQPCEGHWWHFRTFWAEKTNTLRQKGIKDRVDWEHVKNKKKVEGIEVPNKGKLLRAESVQSSLIGRQSPNSDLDRGNIKQLLIITGLSNEGFTSKE